MSDQAPLREMEFLARSANRIEVLTTLADEPRSQQELGDVITASQPTLSRILRDLRDRGWITYDGTRYRASATGRLVEEGITDLRERLETEVRLRDVSEWLPTDALDFDLRRLRDATITISTPTRPNAPIKRMVELLRQTDHALLLSYAFNEQKLNLIRDRTVAGSLTTNGVFSDGAIASLAADPDLQSQLRPILESDAAEIRTHAGDVPVALEITADRTHFLLRDADDIVRASVDTDDQAVRTWAEAVHDRYWRRASPVDADRFLSGSRAGPSR